ncbi:MAG: type I secretion C-terminal target domain-containing protein [Magnetococcus sp. WYHC-3]
MPRLIVGTNLNDSHISFIDHYINDTQNGTYDHGVLFGATSVDYLIGDPGGISNVPQGAGVLIAAGDDFLHGGHSHANDILFGDVLYTDTLAAAMGIGTNPGAGWAVFDLLEGGQSLIDPGWTRADTMDYIKNNSEELATESGGRLGGNDLLFGSAGNDVIFGQEGNDIIGGYWGNDTLYGGSGADTFVFGQHEIFDFNVYSIVSTLYPTTYHDGIDTIKDFNLAEGDRLDISHVLFDYNAAADDILDFVSASEAAGNTTIRFDVDGPGTQMSPVTAIILEGVTGLDLTLATNDGNPIV